MFSVIGKINACCRRKLFKEFINKDYNSYINNTESGSIDMAINSKDKEKCEDNESINIF